MSDLIYVGIDIGGTLAKICVLSNKNLLNSDLPIKFENEEKRLFRHSFQNVDSLFQWLKIHLLPHQQQLRVCVTGGGAAKHNKDLKELFSHSELHIANEFESNVKGIEFVGKSDLQIILYQFIKQSPNQVNTNKKLVSLQQAELPLQFISLGSGVNFQKIGKGSKGLQRLKVDDPKTSFDGYQLQGTCLGGGYIFGLIGLLSQQRQAQKIVGLIKEQQEYRTIYSELIINLMQSAIELSVIHNTPTILPSGSILTISPLQEQFRKAMLLTIQPLPFKRKLISLESLQGYLGCVGVILSKMQTVQQQ